MNIYSVDKNNISDAWKYVTPLLDRIKTLKNEFVYSQVMAGKAWLLVAATDTVQAAMVLEIHEEDDEKIAFILGYAADVDIYDLWEYFIDVAKQIGADKLQFVSPRMGWKRRGEKLGFKIKEIIYERAL